MVDKKGISLGIWGDKTRIFTPCYFFYKKISPQKKVFYVLFLAFSPQKAVNCHFLNDDVDYYVYFCVAI